jgi:hypothetical protein
MDPGRILKNNIKVNPKEIVFESVGWIRLAQDRNQWRDVVNTVMNLPVPQKAGNLVTSRATIGFSRKILPCGVRNSMQGTLVYLSPFLQFCIRNYYNTCLAYRLTRYAQPNQYTLG